MQVVLLQKWSHHPTKERVAGSPLKVTPCFWFCREKTISFTIRQLQNGLLLRSLVAQQHTPQETVNDAGRRDVRTMEFNHLSSNARQRRHALVTGTARLTDFQGGWGRLVWSGQAKENIQKPRGISDFHRFQVWNCSSLGDCGRVGSPQGSEKISLSNSIKWNVFPFRSLPPVHGRLPRPKNR